MQGIFREQKRHWGLYLVQAVFFVYNLQDVIVIVQWHRFFSPTGTVSQTVIKSFLQKKKRHNL